MPTDINAGSNSGNLNAPGRYTYLALGDSYTIGHDVPAEENYPNQTVALLKADSLDGKVKIIAVTGWTTDDLEDEVKKTSAQGELLPAYDIVTLLIGVNNQYQGQAAATYRPKFDALLQRSITLAGNKPGHVIVISIPDWGVTPFANGRDREQIASEIDEYNTINKELADNYGAGYLDVTGWTREAATDLTLLAADKLHPSGKEYARWAARLAAGIKIILR